MPDATALEWSAAELFDRLVRGEGFFMLDVRNRDEFEAWRIDGRRSLPSRNTPYFELLEIAGSDEPLACAAALVNQADASLLPKAGTVLVVCGKGGASGFVAEGLRELGYPAVNLAGGMLAWGNYYSIKPVVQSAGLTIFQIARPGRGCLSHVVASNGEAAIIDPLRHPEPYVDLLRRDGLRARFVLDTHGHADHVSGGRALARALGVPYGLHPYDGIHPLDVMPATYEYEPLRDRQAIAIGAVTLELLHIPGHTLGNLAVRVGDFLIAGDSIFIDSIARPDLGGRGEAWASLHWRSLRRLLALGDGVTVLPGHFSRLAEGDEASVFAATLGSLRRSNAGLAEAQKDEASFVSYILGHLPVFPPQYVDIKRVNLGLKPADDDTASELEIGKNICAMAQAAAR